MNHALSLRDVQRERFESVDLKEVLGDVKVLLNRELMDSGAILETQINAPFLPGIRSYFVNILYNLVLNALKYTEPGLRPVIWIGYRETYGHYVLEVRDNGLGIRLTPETRKKIFDMYGRLSGQTEGKGLGLYLVKTQVEAMNGQIEVTSEPGKGTEFRLRFEKSELPHTSGHTGLPEGAQKKAS